MNAHTTTSWSKWEPWVKGWMVLAPLVAWSGTMLAKNQFQRIWQIKNADASSLPPSWENFVGYGLATAVAFTAFYALLAHLWMRHSSNDTA